MLDPERCNANAQPYPSAPTLRAPDALRACVRRVRGIRTVSQPPTGSITTFMAASITHSNLEAIFRASEHRRTLRTRCGRTIGTRKNSSDIAQSLGALDIWKLYNVKTV